MNGKILITARSFRKTPGPHKDLLVDAGYELVECPNEHPLEADQLAEWMAGVDAAILGLDRVTEAVLAAAPRLRVISRYGVGFDAVDLAAATRHGVVVTITPGANSTAVAELAFALLLSLARDIPYHDRVAKAGKWTRVQGVELAGSTLGIIGLGRIGREVASRALAFGMRVLAFDPVLDPAVVAAAGVESSDLESLLRTSDFVSLHSPLTPETRNLINCQTIDLMKPAAFLINTARGGLVDEAALYEALVTKRLAGAACDVFEKEPPEASGLIALDNFIAAPHIGSATLQTTMKMGLMAAQNALAVLRGERPEGVVNPEVYETQRVAAGGSNG